ncbi:hypothetical protein ABK040_000171 [Willaertia magna]
MWKQLKRSRLLSKTSLVTTIIRNKNLLSESKYFSCTLQNYQTEIESAPKTIKIPESKENQDNTRNNKKNNNKKRRNKLLFWTLGLTLSSSLIFLIYDKIHFNYLYLSNETYLSQHAIPLSLPIIISKKTKENNAGEKQQSNTTTLEQLIVHPRLLWIEKKVLLKLKNLFLKYSENNEIITKEQFFNFLMKEQGMFLNNNENKLEAEKILFKLLKIKALLSDKTNDALLKKPTTLMDIIVGWNSKIIDSFHYMMSNFVDNDSNINRNNSNGMSEINDNTEIKNNQLKDFSLNVDKISFNEFLGFLIGIDQNDPSFRIDETHSDEYSLANYLISSSHNTYLVGNQLTNVLNVLDCWDGKDGEPIIYHGWTLTPKMPFIEAIKTIKEHAFIYGSNYPLILSLEVHCSIEQQKKLAKYMKEVFGDLIILPTHDSLPLLSDCKGKILLQGEFAKLEKKIRQIEFDVLTDIFVENFEYHNDFSLHSNDMKFKSMKKEDVTEVDESVKVLDETFPSFKEAQKETIGQWAADFYEMLFFKSTKELHVKNKTKKVNNTDNENTPMHQMMLNLSEGMGLATILKHKEDIVQHNESYFTRIYPKATRILSTNFNPQFYWTLGCQVISLNYQFCDQYLRMNSALFASNSGVGYVLKDKIFKENSNRKQYNIEILQYIPYINMEETGITFKQLPLAAIEYTKIGDQTIHAVPFDIFKSINPLLPPTNDEEQQRKKIEIDINYEKKTLVSFGVFERKESELRLVSKLLRLGDYRCVGYTAFPLHQLLTGIRFIEINDVETGKPIGGFLISVQNH